ncbi:flavin reductase family protein [Actinomadura sp. HBU206391]|uniref:flavin reductase family protein n=1 Tax=Actinomadura sp. HBU206391 TaxID=2731692 RepID=UPI001650CEF0|nr:flavin reductase family protein [Actinomadura sp. HBU206391]MBC6457788.1 flavin reductase [Actinomadura sp. HBU206391]
MNAGPLPSSPDAAVDRDEFRRVVGRFPTGITIVSTATGGVDHAMTVSAFTSLSLDPLLVLFCAEKIARFHDVVVSAGEWAVSVLGEGGRDVSQWFATRGRPMDGRLPGWNTVRGAHTGAAIFSDAVAALECRTHAVHDGGDHSIVVGEVLGVSRPDPGGRPLVYYEGRYGGLA